MSVVPRTPTGLAIKALKRMLSLSTAFCEGVGVESEASALEYIFVPRKKPKRNQLDKPFAVIGPAGSGSLDTEPVAFGAANYLRLLGALDLMIVRDVGDHADEEDELIDFLNFSEGVYLDLLALAGVDDHLSIVGAPRVYGPAKSADTKVAGDKAQKPFYKAVYAISWK